MVGVAGAGTASAQQLSRTFGYTCTAFAAGTHSFTAEVTANLPDEVVVGRPGRTITVNAVAKVEASLTKWLADSNMSTVEGTVDASAHVDAPQKQLDIAVPFRMAKTTAPASGPFKIKATADVTTPTFDHPGRATVTTGSIALHIIAKNAAGTMWLQSDTTCTLNAGQSNVVTSFDIRTASSKPSATPKPTTGPVGSTTPKHTTGPVAPAAPGRTNGPVVADVQKPATAKGAGPATGRVTAPGAPSAEPLGAPGAEPSRVTEDNSGQTKPSSIEPTTAGEPPATGHGTRDLVMPAVGVLIACAAAFFLGTRLKNHRRTSDDREQRPLDPKQGLLTTGVSDGGPDIGHRRRANAAARRPRGHGCGETPRGNMGRSVTENGNLLLGRHAPNQTGHRIPDARAGEDADLNNQLSDLLKAEKANAAIHEEPGTEDARRT